MNDEFVLWRNHPITQVLWDEYKRRIERLTAELVEQTSSGDPRIMAEKAGAIKAYRDVLDIDLFEETHGN